MTRATRPCALMTALCLCLGLGPGAVGFAAAQAQETRPAQASTDKGVLGGVKRGTDAAERGIERAGDATLRGVNRASDSATRPVRRIGEAFGRRLEQGPGGGRARNPARTGPQAEGP